MMAGFLRVVAGGRLASIGGGDCVIGRSVYCTLSVDDPSVSRLHAVLRRVGDGLEIEDLGSTNGTFVNGSRIGRTPSRIAVGDEILVGLLRVELTLAEEALADRIETEKPPRDEDEQPTGTFKMPPALKGTAARRRARGQR